MTKQMRKEEITATQKRYPNNNCISKLGHFNLTNLHKLVLIALPRDAIRFLLEHLLRKKENAQFHMWVQRCVLLRPFVQFIVSVKLVPCEWISFCTKSLVDALVSVTHVFDEAQYLGQIEIQHPVHRITPCVTGHVHSMPMNL